MFARAAALAALAAICAAWLARTTGPRPLAATLLALAALAELTSFAARAQIDGAPDDYYPRVAALERLQREFPPGRVCGVDCLPANLAQVAGLRDIRGYDGVDPAHLVELFEAGTKTVSGESATSLGAPFPQPPYAVTQWLRPTRSGIFRMLSLRYLIHRGHPPADCSPCLVDQDYWIEELPDWLPRAYLPQRLETLSDQRQVLARLTDPRFDPLEVAYTVGRPASHRPGSSLATANHLAAALIPEQNTPDTVSMVRDDPCQVVLATNLQRARWVVLADLWLPDWRVWVNGREQPVCRVNHVLRGVLAPAGKARLEFRYTPRSLVRGCWLALAAGICECVRTLRRRRELAPPAGYTETS